MYTFISIYVYACVPACAAFYRCLIQNIGHSYYSIELVAHLGLFLDYKNSITKLYLVKMKLLSRL